MLYRFKRYFRTYNARRVARLIDNSLKSQGIKEEEIKVQRDLYFDKITGIVNKIEFDTDFLGIIADKIKSYSEFVEKIDYVLDAQEMDLNEYLNTKILIKLVLKGTDIELYLQIARDFKLYKLTENEQGDIDKLMDFVKIPLIDKVKIANLMVFTKNANCPLSQKKIVKFYDSYRPFTEDLDSLKDAWILAHEKLEVKHNFPITVEDLIQTAKYNHNPKTFVNNLARILDNEISIPFEKFKILDLDDSKITDLVTLLIKTKFAGIIVDFEMVYNDLKVLDVWEILRYIVRFKDASFMLDYPKLRNYFFYSKDLEKLLRAFIYNNQKNIFSDYLKLYSNIIEVMSVKPKNVNVDPLLFVVAVEKAINMNILNIETEKNEKTTEQVKQDYIAGHDVFANLSVIELLTNYNINISYTLSKFIEKSFGNEENRIQEFKKLIMSAIQPVLFEGETFYVTTKDHIEIKANIIIEAVANLNNFFNGSDEKMLIQRANTILIDEIQRKYNHDEIVLNIDKIANNVLFRLLEETPTSTPDYFSHKLMHKVNQHGTIEENDHKDKQEHNVNKKNEHTIDEKSEFINKHEDKLIKISKFTPRKVIIPKIEFIKETFKEFEKEKENYEIHKHHLEAEIEKLKAEIELKKAWAKSENLKYLILKDEEPPKSEH